MIDRLQYCCRYFLNSPKRSGVLGLIVSRNVVDQAKRKPLLELCKTRWAERHSANQHFYQAFVFIVEALELIDFKRHLAKYGDTYDDWEPASRNDAQQILSSITSFEFIVVFMTMYQYLSHLVGITVKLQKRALHCKNWGVEVAPGCQISRYYIDTGVVVYHPVSVQGRVAFTATLLGCQNIMLLANNNNNYYYN